MNYRVPSKLSSSCNDIGAISNLLTEAHAVNKNLNNILKQHHNQETQKFFPNNYRQIEELFSENSKAIAVLSNELLNSLNEAMPLPKSNLMLFSDLTTKQSQPKFKTGSKHQPINLSKEIKTGFKRRRLQTDVSFISPQKKVVLPFSLQKKPKGKKKCRIESCNTKAIGRLGLCKKHGGGKRCSIEGCNKASQGRNGKCVSHGGGKRCIHSNCTKLARGKSNLCIPHGGGNRCTVPDCNKLAQGGTQRCIRHGGGKRCKFVETVFVPDSNTPKTVFCQKSAVASTHYCVAHGGGKRCKHVGCKKGAVGKTEFCVRHGGGKRCQTPDCSKSAVGKSTRCISCGGTR